MGYFVDTRCRISGLRAISTEIRGFGPVRVMAAAVMVAGLAGCTQLPTKLEAPDEEPQIAGSASRRNYTPLEPAFSCMAKLLRERNQPPIGVAVGDVKDYTGKYSQSEGNAITQGGALMIYSALGKLGGTVQVQERFDTRIAELELAYTDRRQLGDGRTYQVEQGKPAVPWVPYFGGSILRSDYYIVGGITEVNYNVASGGWEASLSNMGARNRTFTMNIGVDLRIVDTRSLLVVKTVSLQKQIVGQEVGANVYRFFNSELLDINVGSKKQEPLQLGVRTTIEHGVLELVGAITGVDQAPCVNNSFDQYALKVAEANKPQAPASAAAAPASAAASGVKPASAAAVVPAAAPARAAAPAAPGAEAVGAGGLTPQNAVGGATGGAGTVAVAFDFTSSAISSQSASVIETLAKEAAQGNVVTIQLIARDNEVAPSMQRRELTNQRVKAVTDALVAKGVASSRIGVTWLPDPTDSGITRHGAGYQLIASMVIAK